MVKRLTAEEKTDIIRRHEAGETNATLAADFKVSENCIWYTCKKAGKVKKPGKTHKREAGQDAQAGGFKAAIQAMIDKAVEAKLQPLALRLSDLAGGIDARIEAALHEMVK